ncbi:unnamed protein product [Pseudo-nitzschia multistriata]|uniref:O-fucosyltransferase family protein n=1 Tax=Pseudo-nitzschia multistriata TaxID=183589 RepID=A0A448ZPV8_9STRA|nr:unnamed protein product [Pseudo-nitzschia multistriata]
MASKQRERIKAFLLVVFNLLAANTFYLCYVCMYILSEDMDVSEHHPEQVHVPHPEAHLLENQKLHHRLHNPNHIEWNGFRKGKANGTVERNENKNKNENNSNINTNTNNRNEHQTDTGNKQKHTGEGHPQSTRNEKPHGNETNNTQQHPLLDCTRYGGPHDFDSLDEMVYWKHIPEDATYQSRFKNKGDKGEQFLTFDTDMSGFNNQRMVFEINVATAIATGRTLVMPRDRVMDHIHKTHKFAMDDFFDLQKIAGELPDILKLMTIDDYISQEGGPEKLNIPRDFTGFGKKVGEMIREIQEDKTRLTSNYYNHHDKFLINHVNDLHCNVTEHGEEYCSNYTDWINQRHVSKTHGIWQFYLDEFFHDHPKVVCPKWGSSICLLTIPVFDAPNHNNTIINTTDNTSSSDRFKAWMKDLDGNVWERQNSFIGNPPLVNDPPKKRVSELYQARNGLCVYDQNMQQSKYYHMRDTADRESRLIGHWYDYIFFEDWKEDLWMKRFMRDKLKYNDLIQCTAAKIVADIRKTSKTLYNHPDGQFHSMHVRRTDLTKFYKDYDIDRNASEIYNELKRHIVPKDSVVFVATDEADKHWFDVFRENYQRVYFLDDFVEGYLKDIPKEYYGMIDQLVASRGEHFVGTYYSTFTGYINRLRGYHSQKHYNPNLVNSLRKPPREAKGIIPSWFYSPKTKIGVYQRYAPVGSTFFEMEYPLAWRNIDFGVGAGADPTA